MLYSRTYIPMNVAIDSLKPNCTYTVMQEQGKDEVLIWKDETNTAPTADEIAAEQARLLALEPLRCLRENRNALLAETDWMALSDVTMSDAWKTYRQALRDLPANTKDPSNPTYPTKPE
jgi:hypothetical protein|tara:strand:+ start:3096 stop:3452 length:357 start_codon:yes stop_codon:yes gene_type:complete